MAESAAAGSDNQSKRKSWRSSDVLIEIAEPGDDSDFIPDAHIVAVIAAYDGETPWSIRGSARRAAPGV